LKLSLIPVEDSSNRVGVEERHGRSHDAEQQLLVDQLRRAGAAQQERYVHRDLQRFQNFYSIEKFNNNVH
jgi:hypothetical protein